MPKVGEQFSGKSEKSVRVSAACWQRIKVASAVLNESLSMFLEKAVEQRIETANGLRGVDLAAGGRRVAQVQWPEGAEAAPGAASKEPF